MQKIKDFLKGGKGKLILRIIIVLLLVGALIWVIWLNIQLNDKTAQIERLNDEIRDVKTDLFSSGLKISGLKDDLKEEVEMKEFNAELGIYFASKLDELNYIFLEYDKLVGDLDRLLKDDCYSYNMEATMRTYGDITRRYDDIVNQYLALDEEIRIFLSELDIQYN